MIQCTTKMFTVRKVQSYLLEGQGMVIRDSLSNRQSLLMSRMTWRSAGRAFRYTRSLYKRCSFVANSVALGQIHKTWVHGPLSPGFSPWGPLFIWDFLERRYLAQCSQFKKCQTWMRLLRELTRTTMGLLLQSSLRYIKGLQIKKDVFIISRLNSQLIHSGYWKGHLRQQQPQSRHRLGKVQILYICNTKKFKFSNLCRWTHTTPCQTRHLLEASRSLVLAERGASMVLRIIQRYSLYIYWIWWEVYRGIDYTV